MGGVTGVTCVRVLQNGTNLDPETPPPSRSRSQRGEAEASGSQSRDQYLLSGFEVVLVPWWGMDPGSIISQFLSRNSNKITRNKRSCATTGPPYSTRRGDANRCLWCWLESGWEAAVALGHSGPVIESLVVLLH